MEPGSKIDYQSNDFRFDIENFKAAIGDHGRTFMIILDESLAPWGAKLVGHKLYLGREAKQHNFLHYKSTVPYRNN